MKPRSEIEREALEVVARLDKVAGNSALRALKRVGRALKTSIPARYRVMLVVSGGDPYRVGAVVARSLLYYERRYRRIAGRRPLSLLYVFHDEFDDARIRKEIVKRAVKEKASLLEQTTARYEESEKYLGTTFQALVLDLTNDLKPNDVGRLVEVVEGGGLIVLEAPSWEEWDTRLTLFKQNLLVPGYTEPRHIFISWFKRKLLEHKTNIFVYDADRGELISGEPLKQVPSRKASKVRIPEKTLFPQELYKLALTNDQARLVKAMEWLYEKPGKGKRKVIVATADRGRGKSCGVGIGLAGLARELGKVKHRVRILVTAPSLSNVQSLMELALRAAETIGLKAKPVKRGGKILEIQGRNFSIEYWEPIEIPRLSADIVAVDEASGIHVPLLHKIWRAHKRIVFAATIHGYEGAGRGFNIRFLQEVEKDKNTEIRRVELSEPIRYAPGDPVERWLFDVLLLDAEPARLEEEDYNDIRAGRVEYLALDPEWLFSPEGEETLRQLFGIYVLAHYRNEPDDLGRLADAPHHIVRALRTAGSGKIVSAAQVAVEGGLDDTLIDRLLRGERVAGNIIPDRLLKHLRIVEFGRMRGWRVVRIATHPDAQDMGLGSRLLENLYREVVSRGLDWLGSGFGVNEKLLNFWAKNGFLTLHISPDRNPVSGEYTVLVLKPVSDTARLAALVGSVEYKWKLLHSLYDTYRDLETRIAIMMLDQPPSGIDPSYRPRATPILRDRAWVYNYGPMTYESANDMIVELARTYWMHPAQARPPLTMEEKHILVAKILQGKPWGEVAEELGVKEYRVMSGLKELVRKLSEHYYSVSRDTPVGVSLEDAARPYDWVVHYYYKGGRGAHVTGGEGAGNAGPGGEADRSGDTARQEAPRDKGGGPVDGGTPG
ncbi:MAG: tRNA(Met) cytidine acetyltransferase TmcA [Desulfurococcales archaeon]|nr:tRNA(Met) cytidine acetyltransferase TmcA [Desulfurococcales archaeon]